MNSKHRSILGGLFFIQGLLQVGFGLIMLTADVVMTFSSVMISFALAVPSLFGGYNLLKGYSSAHSILSIAAIISLFSFPVGTVLAIYYYWFWKYQCGSPNPFKPPVTHSTAATD